MRHWSTCCKHYVISLTTIYSVIIVLETELFDYLQIGLIGSHYSFCVIGLIFMGFANTFRIFEPQKYIHK